MAKAIDNAARADYMAAKCEEALALLEERKIAAAKIVLRMAVARHQPKQARPR